MATGLIKPPAKSSAKMNGRWSIVPLKVNVSLGRDAEERDPVAVSEQASNVLSAVAAASYQTKQGIEALRSEIADKEAAVAEANDKRSKVEVALAELEQRLREADEQRQEQDGALAAQATTIATLEGQREELQQRLTELQAEGDELRDHLGELEASLAGEQVRLEETQQELAAGTKSNKAWNKTG